MSVNKGFTLIEILIVIVIISIVAGFAIITFGDFGASRRILFSAEQLVNTLKLTQQQAILENSTLGLRIDNQGYQILKFDNSQSWKAISNKGIFKVNYFPQNTFITLKTDNKSFKNSPAIIINSSGDVTPFTLTFGTNKDTAICVLTTTKNGKFKLQPADTE